MNKLLKIDILLVFLTFIGLCYLYYNNKITLVYAFFILLFYIISKVIGYLILPYYNFSIFLNFLTQSSKIGMFSGFEIFKFILVLLLYIGFIFINPFFWIVESMLVISMRIWGYYFIKNRDSVYQ